MILSEVQSLYAYDSLGRKTSRMDNDTWEYYIYDGMNLVADYDAYNGRIIRTYTYGPGVDNIQSMTIYDEYGGSETYYYIKDASNTVHVLVDEDGLIVEYYYYDAFGNVKMRDENYQWMTESNYGNRFLFQGREYDYDTALYYFRARWYEPETGRWLSPDPIGISGGLNLYTFCGNDPVNFIDPTGKGGIQFGNYFLGWGDPWVVFDTPNFEVVADIASSITTGMLSGSAKGCHDIWDSADQFLSDQFHLNLPANPYRPLPPKEESCEEDTIAEMSETVVLFVTDIFAGGINAVNKMLNLGRKHIGNEMKKIN